MDTYLAMQALNVQSVRVGGHFRLREVQEEKLTDSGFPTATSGVD
jgi:hypothetical protein